MILGETLDHPLGPVAQCDQAGGRDDPDLSHSTADQLPRPACAPDEVVRPDDDAADRAGKALREAERDAVRRAGEIRRADPEGDDRVPEAGPAAVQREAAPS